MTIQVQRENLMQLLEAAIAAANPLLCVPPALPEPPEDRRLIILGAGKGSAAMVQAAEEYYLDRDTPVPITGCAVTRSRLHIADQGDSIAGRRTPSTR